MAARAEAMNASIASALRTVPGPKRVVAFLSPRPTVTETPFPNVALVFFAALRAPNVSIVVESLILRATVAGLARLIVALPPEGARIVKSFLTSMPASSA